MEGLRITTTSSSSSNGEDAETVAEIMSLTQEALNLATVAIHFDKQDNYIGAYDYYDKCILNIDEVMSKLPRTSAQWMKMMELRISYDDRMEQLKEMEKDNRNSMSMFGGGGGGGGGGGSSTSSASVRSVSMESSSSMASTTSTTSSTGGGGTPSKGAATSSSSSAKLLMKAKLQAQEELNFVEMSLESFVYEPPPTNVPEIPFWQLRNIQRTIEDGGYITEAMFVPKRCWTQTDVKFLGLNSKTAAFDFIVNLLNSYVDPLVMKSDEASVTQAEEAFQKVMEELISLQNQLSKSFSYIKESKVDENGGNDDNGNGTSNNSNNAGNSGGDFRESVSSPSTTSNKSWAKYVATVGKSVKKYAEVGISRLAAAVPSKLTNEELSEYTKLICELCDRSQILASWYRYVSGVLQHMTTIQNPVQADIMDISSKQTSTSEQFRQLLKDIPTPEVYGKLDNIAQLLWNISMAFRDIVCEILLRDVENLLEKYLIKTRKSYSRMYWDQEGNE